MSSNPYCERHEWPSNMGMSCPDCAALAALAQKLESAQKDADLWRKQASLDHQQLESVQRELAHWKDCHGVTADKLALTELQNSDLISRIYTLGLMCDKVPGLEAGYCPDVGQPRDNVTRIGIALKRFIEKRNDLAPRNGIYHCDLNNCNDMTERKCMCLCEKCVEAKREDH